MAPWMGHGRGGGRPSPAALGLLVLGGAFRSVNPSNMGEGETSENVANKYQARLMSLNVHNPENLSHILMTYSKKTFVFETNETSFFLCKETLFRT